MESDMEKEITPFASIHRPEQPVFYMLPPRRLQPALLAGYIVINYQLRHRMPLGMSKPFISTFLNFDSSCVFFTIITDTRDSSAKNALV